MSFLPASYVFRISPMYFAVFIMRFSFAFTTVSLQFLVPNPLDRGIVSAAYPFMEMSSALLLGVFVDKVGRKWIIITALLCSSVISFSFTLTKSIPLLIVIHALQGICASAIVIATLALLTDFARIDNRGREMGGYDFFTIAGYGIGFVFAAFLIAGDSLKAYLPFYAGASIALAGGIVCIFILKDSKTTLPQVFSVRDNLKKISANKSTLTLIPTWFVLMTIIGVALTYTRELSSVLFPGAFPLFEAGVTHGPTLRTGLATIILLVIGVGIVAISQTSFGQISDKIGRNKVAFVGQISLLGLLVTLSTTILNPLNRIMFLALLGIFGLGLLAFAPAALAELADVAPESGRGSTMGLYSLTVGAGTIFGPLAGGALVSHFGPEYGLSILFGFLSLMMVVILVPRFLDRRSLLS